MTVSSEEYGRTPPAARVERDPVGQAERRACGRRLRRMAARRDLCAGLLALNLLAILVIHGTEDKLLRRTARLFRLRSRSRIFPPCSTTSCLSGITGILALLAVPRLGEPRSLAVPLAGAGGDLPRPVLRRGGADARGTPTDRQSLHRCEGHLLLQLGDPRRDLCASRRPDLPALRPGAAAQGGGADHPRWAACTWPARWASSSSVGSTPPATGWKPRVSCCSPPSRKASRCSASWSSPMALLRLLASDDGRLRPVDAAGELFAARLRSSRRGWRVV